jgi:Kef-type K+ transport system membrane component KefB
MIPLLLLFAVVGLMQAARSFSDSVAAGGTELAFGFLLLSAYFTGRLFGSLGLPRLTGYLIAGVLAGPFVLDLVTTDMTRSLRVVNGVASCILGLVAGSELNLKRVRPLARTLRGLMIFAVIGGIAVVAGVLFLIRPLLPLFDGMALTESVVVCLLLGVALIPQSPAVAIAVLSETRADGPLSQTILASVVVADLVVIVLYAIAAAITGAVIGGGIDVLHTAGAVSWELLGSIAFGVAIGMLIGVFVRTVKQGASMFALMICIVVAEIGSRVHLDPLVVMLAAGIWLENFSSAKSHDLLNSFESAQLPVFLVWFALAGTKLDVVTLWAMIIPVLILAGSRGVAFYLGSRVAAGLSKPPPAVASHAWIGLVPQAGLSLAFVVVIQNTFPTFGAAAGVLLLSVLGVNQLLAPILLRRALIRSGEAGKKASVDFASNGH